MSRQEARTLLYRISRGWWPADSPLYREALRRANYRKRYRREMKMISTLENLGYHRARLTGRFDPEPELEFPGEGKQERHARHP